MNHKSDNLCIKSRVKCYFFADILTSFKRPLPQFNLQIIELFKMILFIKSRSYITYIGP